MASIRAGGRNFEASLAVFDKDGTLVDLDSSWAGATERWLRASAAGDPQALEALALALGFDLRGRRIVPDGVVAAGTLDDMASVTRQVLAAHGVDEGTAADRLEVARTSAVAEAADLAHMAPSGDVARLFGALHQSGVAIGVLTSDDRAVTEATLVVLGVAQLVHGMVAGDDPVPAKPSPAGVLRLAADAGVEPGRVVVIGDSVSDVLAGRAAGAGGTVAVGRSAEAREIADAWVETIDDVEPVGPYPMSP